MKKKTLSIVIAFALVLTLLPVTAFAAGNIDVSDWTVLTGSTTGKTIGSSGTISYYKLETNTTFTNSTVGGSGLTIADGATVYIYIPAGVTLTVKGSNGADAENGGASTPGKFIFGEHSRESCSFNSFPIDGEPSTSGQGGKGATGGGAGIYVPGNAKLVVYGDGTLAAVGGNGGKAGNGADGTISLYWYYSCCYEGWCDITAYFIGCNQPNYPVTSCHASKNKNASWWHRGLTGAGGAGGGGAAGGGAAIGTSGADGNCGVDGADGQLGTIEGNISSNRAVTSENNTTSLSALAAGSVYIASGVQTTLSGGQGGDAGIRPAFMEIASYTHNRYSDKNYGKTTQNLALSQGQSGGAGASGGKGASIGMGGGGGAGGAGGDAGAYIFSSLTPEESNQGSNGQVNGAVGAENANTTLSTADGCIFPVTLNNQGTTTSILATYGSAMPAVTVPTREDYDFLGYFNADGDQYYDANGTGVRKWDYIGDQTLYARWKQHGVRNFSVLTDDPETEDVENPIAFDVFALVDTGASDYADITYYVSIEWSVDTSGIEFENGALYEWSTTELKYVPVVDKTVQLLGDNTSVDMTITVTNRSNAAVSYAVSYADHEDDLTTSETKAETSAADSTGTIDSADQNGAATAAPGSGHVYAINAVKLNDSGNAAQSAVYSATVTVTGVADGVIITDAADLTLGTYTVTLGAA